MTATTTYRIAEVAARSGFTPATLRYYEDRGLVRPRRSDAGHRLYDDRALQRLRFVARAKQLGCSLDEIAELAGVWDGGRCGHVQRRLRAAVEARVAASRQQITELSRMTASLQRTAAALGGESTPGACGDTCACMTDDAATGTPAAVPPATVPWAADRADRAGESDPARGPAIACTLDDRRLGTRLGAWKALLTPPDDGNPGGVVAREAVDGGVRLTFGPGTDVAEVARLAAAEQDCCRFLRFALSIDARGLALEVRAPGDAADVVTALFGAPA